MCTSGLYKIELQILDHLVEDIKRFWDIFVSEASVYEQFNVHIRKAHRRSSRRRATRMQETDKLMEEQEEGERPTVYTEEGSSS